MKSISRPDDVCISADDTASQACYDPTTSDQRSNDNKRLLSKTKLDAIEGRIAIAKQVCQAQGLRFTPLREKVFRLILQAVKPIGAYDLLAQLQQENKKTIAPPTVYRSLEFLLNHGFIHQLSSSNAFFPCCQPDDQHTAAFLICQRCGKVEEFGHTPIEHVVHQVATESKFAIHTTVIELLGTCEKCQTLI